MSAAFPKSDEEIMAHARDLVTNGGFAVFPSDVAHVEVRRRRRWWSLRKEWVRLGSFDAVPVREAVKRADADR